MPLAEATIRPLVGEWAAAVAGTWTAEETDAIVDLILQISGQVTPHVVPDVPQTAERLQRYLVTRVIGRLEDWLAGAAARLRDAYGIVSVRLTADGGGPAVGLRSATEDELVALPGVDRVLATAIGSFVTQQPKLANEDRLADVDGIGPGRLRRLRAASYLDEPRLALLSPRLLAFLLTPRMVPFLRLLEESDLTLVFGDGSTFLRRPMPEGRTPAERRADFFELVLAQSTRGASVASGVLASEAERWLDRHAARSNIVATLAPADGGVLVNDAYLAAARALIDGANTSVKLMVFLGTVASGTDLAPGPLRLVEAMEAASGRGLTVRAILDQDDGGEPYGSVFINRPLVQRFAANGVEVKLDDEATLLHSKVLITDRQAALVGSHNWTRNALYETHELSILVESPVLAAQFDDRFQTLWDQLPVL